MRRNGANKSKAENRAAHLKFVHGILDFEYQIILNSQSGVCAICGKVNADGRPLAVDHCHKTGKMRQLLCFRCNNGLGCFGDDPELVLKASEYLKRHGVSHERNSDEVGS